MTVDEAIMILELNSICSPRATEFKKAVEIAKDATEKQIPKKAIDDGTQFAICPECGASVNKDIEQVYNGETSYCICCGQALDWSDTGG